MNFASSIIILLLFVMIYGWYIFDNQNRHSNTIIFIMSILFLILFMIQYINMNPPESFFFEVSPRRLKCLKEQVSTAHPNTSRSCNCCQKGTVGGYPPNYMDWIQKSSGDWSRADNWSSIKDESLPPINRVDG